MSIWNRGAAKQPSPQSGNTEQTQQQQTQQTEQTQQTQQTQEQTQQAPQFVTVDQFNALNESINSLKDNMLNIAGQGRQEPTQQTQQVQIEDVTDDDYERAIAGEIQDKRQAAAIIRKRHNADIQRNNQQLQQQIQQLQEVGLGSIAGLTKQSIETMPHYKNYKKEIDAAINTLPPQQRVNPEALKGVYNYVVGQHFEEIMQSEKEAWLRQQQQESTQQTTGRQQGNTRQQNTNTKQQQIGGIPDPTEVLDPSALEAIRSKYGVLDVDRYARSQGYKEGWEGLYTKVYKKIFESEGNA